MRSGQLIVKILDKNLRGTFSVPEMKIFKVGSLKIAQSIPCPHQTLVGECIVSVAFMDIKS